MAKETRKQEPEMEEPTLTVAWTCEVEGCNYVLYEAGDSDRVALHVADHTRQHDDPDGWKADAEAGALEEME